MDIKYMTPGELVPYDKNPRINDEAVDLVANSIHEFGFKQPIVIDTDNVIIAGHTRWKAAKKLKLKEVPVIMANDLTPAQVKAYRLADNKVAEASDWDPELLDFELDELEDLDFDMEPFGFDSEEEQEEETIEEDDYVADEQLEPLTETGQIWILGGHRLMVGDSTDKNDATKLLKGESMNLVFTDPPYGMKKERDGVMNDNLNYDDLLEFNRKWIALSLEALAPNGSWYCWGTDEPLMDIYSAIFKPLIKNHKATFRNLITWDKGNTQGERSPNFRQYPVVSEKCLFMMQGSLELSPNADEFLEEYDPIRSYMEEEAKAAQLDAKKLKEICGVGMFGHWFTKSQWTLIPEAHYRELQSYFKGQYFQKSYQDIKDQYETAYQQVRKKQAYFDNTHDSMTDVWHFARTSEQEREHTGNHATPKPIALCARAIRSSTAEGGEGFGSVWRLWVNANSVRAVRQKLLYDGAISSIRRRNYKPLGALYWDESEDARRCQLKA